jgi:hypothetical protein
MRYKILTAFTICVLAICCGAKTAERITNLPSDQNQWHVSVVGNGAQYQKVLAWFESGQLKALKDQVHFHAVPADSATYRDRYASNIKALPTVRVQDGEGYVIYESAGNQVPKSGADLYSAIAGAKAGKALLPWRRKHSNVAPAPEPAPDLSVVPLPVNEQAPVDEPVLGSDIEWPWVAGCILLLIAGLIAGQVEKSHEYHKSKGN